MGQGSSVDLHKNELIKSTVDVNDVGKIFVMRSGRAMLAMPSIIEITTIFTTMCRT